MNTPSPLPLESTRSLSGLELMQALAAGTLPPPPIIGLMMARLVEVELGRVAFAGEPGAQHYNPLGGVHGGYAATLLDSCMGCAVHTTLPVATGYTTVELKISYVRGMTATTGPVRAEGSVLNTGRRVAFAEGRLVDRDGRLLAHGTTTCLIFPLPP